MNADRNENAAGRAQPVKRGPHTIRFSAPEWDRIEEFSGARGLSPAAFVRYAALACVFHVKLPPVPAQSCHPVQAKVATCSIEGCHPSERSDAERLESVGG